MPIHTFYGTKEYKDRMAYVFLEADKSFTVVMIKDANIIEERSIVGHSEQYAEDCAENWVLGII